MDNKVLVKELITVSILHRCHIMTDASQTGLYFGQPMMLEYILSHPDCTQRELAKALNISPASAATSLGRIEKSGFIARRQDEADSRKNRLSVTESGLKALEAFRAVCDTTDTQLLSGFGEDEREQLFSFLQRLHENLAQNISREDLRKTIKSGGKR